MNRFSRSVASVLIVLAGLSSSACGQGDKASRPSPPETATGKAGNASITISYGSPSVRGREIWGGLVPYDKFWRAGANEATIFETDKPVRVEGKEIPAGKYSLFFKPGKTGWTLVLNSETGQWGIKRSGEANRDPAKDVLTVMVTPKMVSTVQERLQFSVADPGVIFKWEKAEVPISITSN